jgi:hypothetical protein
MFLNAITESSWFRRLAIICGGLLQDATEMKLDVLSAVHFTSGARNMITYATIKNYFVKCAFLIDHVSSNEDNAVELSKAEEDDWHSLPLGECSLRTRQHVTVLLKSVESRVSTRCYSNTRLTRPEE